MEEIARRVQLGTLASRDRLRLLLVDAINGEKVDGKLDDVDVARLKKAFSVTTKTNNVDDIDLQSEIILRWLAKEPR